MKIEYKKEKNYEVKTNFNQKLNGMKTDINEHIDASLDEAKSELKKQIEGNKTDINDHIDVAPDRIAQHT